MSENTEVQSNESAQSSENNTEEQIVVTKSAEELAKRLKEVSLEAIVTGKQIGRAHV